MSGKESTYDEYFLMGADDAAGYARAKLDTFKASGELESKEIGNGNLNYIFRVRDGKNGASVIIKQAGGTARISEDFKISTDRNRIEYEILKLEGELAPGLVPDVYLYDPVMCCCAMEDLSDHVIMRDALLDRGTFPVFADHVSTFMVNTLLLTSDVVMDHKKKKELSKRFVNPDLCEITEDLVYMEPFNDTKGRNDVFPANKEFVARELYGDKRLRLETAKMKFDFYCNAQSLIHGDLHTGSIFVRRDSTKVIDPEFAFYGPAGYDVGNIVANLIFAWVNADTTIGEAKARDRYTGWLEETLRSVMDLFVSKWNAAWRERVTETVARYDGFAQWYLSGVLRDTAGVTGLELCRRTVGIAHVRDIVSIADRAQRTRAERFCLTVAKRCIFERDAVRSADDYLGIMRAVAREYPRS